jgi:hypothetical protein
MCPNFCMTLIDIKIIRNIFLYWKYLRTSSRGGQPPQKWNFKDHRIICCGYTIWTFSLGWVIRLSSFLLHCVLRQKYRVRITYNSKSFEFKVAAKRFSVFLGLLVTTYETCCINWDTILQSDSTTAGLIVIAIGKSLILYLRNKLLRLFYVYFNCLIVLSTYY